MRNYVSLGLKKISKIFIHIGFFLKNKAREMYTTTEDAEEIEREIREQPWHDIVGDKTFRLGYDLDRDSIVVDIGGYIGDWSSAIYNMYSPKIYIFEPVNVYANEIIRRFKHNNDVKITVAGCGRRDEGANIYISQGGTSLIHKSNRKENIKIIDIHKFITGLDKRINLMKINIEGAEYDLILYLIETGDIKKVDNIQVQFHPFVSEAQEKKRALYERLSETHNQTYNFDYVWENWKLKTKQ